MTTETADTINIEKREPSMPVPTDPKEWVRKFKAFRSLNDQVEDVHTFLVENKGIDYTKYLNAVHDSEAEEGSLGADNFFAAFLIRTQAQKQLHPLGKKDIATISKALGVVLRRYGLGRKERRDTVGGQKVPDTNGEAVAE